MSKAEHIHDVDESRSAAPPSDPIKKLLQNAYADHPRLSIPSSIINVKEDRKSEVSPTGDFKEHSKEHGINSEKLSRSESARSQERNSFTAAPAGGVLEIPPIKYGASTPARDFLSYASDRKIETEKPLKIAASMEPRRRIDYDGQEVSANGITLTADTPQGSLKVSSDVTSPTGQNGFTSDSTAINWTFRNGKTIGLASDSQNGYQAHFGVPIGRSGNTVIDLIVSERFVGAGLAVTIPTWNPFDKK